MTYNVFVVTLNLALSVHLLSHTHTSVTMRLHVMQRTVLPRHFCLFVCPSVCLFVCPSNVCIVTKRKKLVKTYLYHMKERLS